MGILDESSSFNEEVIEKEKVKNPIRSLPKSFEPIEIIKKISNMDFKKIESAIEAEIEFRKIPSYPRDTSVPQYSPPMLYN